MKKMIRGKPMTRSELRKHQQQIRENLRRPVRVLCSGLGNQLVRSDEERFKYKAVHVWANQVRKAHRWIGK